MEKSSSSQYHYGYIIAGACFSIQAVGVGTYVAFGVFFNPLMTEFGWSRALISGASSLAFLVQGIFGIFVGRFNDKTGPRVLMTITAVFLGAGCMLMSQVGTVWQLYFFFGIVFGIGLSSIDVIALTTITRWFARNRGMMTGIVKVGTGAGQFTLPLLASALIACYGWRNAYVIIGAVAMIMLVGIAQLLRRDPSKIRPSQKQGEVKQAPTPDHTADGLSFKQARGTVQLWTVCVVNLTLVFCLMTILVHIVPHARDLGLSPVRAAGVLSTIGAVSMIGRFVTGMAIDRTSSKKAMIVCFFLLIAALLWLQTADTLWMLYVFACVYGLAHGGFFTAISPIVAELFGILSHGAIFGTVVCFGTVGGAFGPMLAGYVFDVAGSYNQAFLLITGLSAVGLAMLLSLKPVRPDIVKSLSPPAIEPAG